MQDPGVDPMHLALTAAAVYFERQEAAAKLAGLPLDYLRRRWGYTTPRYAPADHLFSGGDPIFPTSDASDVDVWLRVAEAYGPMWQASEPAPLSRVLADLTTLLKPPASSEAFFARLVSAAVRENLAALGAG
jgi:hypothetical protein